MILDVIFKAAVFLILLSVLVLVHEFGHYVVGRFFGVGVLEFALGLPFTKPLWSKKTKNGMIVSLYPILFGGFVRLLGEEQEVNVTNNSSDTTTTINSVNQQSQVKGEFFYRKDVKTRLAVIVAGVAMNLILAFAAFYIFLGFSGFKIVVPRFADYRFLSPFEPRVVINFVEKGSPADQAGIKPSMVVLSVDNEQVLDLKKFQTYIKGHSGKEIDIKLTDLNLTKNFEVAVTPRVNPPQGQGSMGVGLSEAGLISFGGGTGKLTSGFVYGVDMFRYNWQVIGSLASDSVKKKNAEPLADSVSGPVGIYNIVGNIIDIGGWQAVLAMVNFLGMMSLSLAFMNILPIPAMDGGKMFFLLIEGIFRKKLSARSENFVNQIGFALIIGLMLVISFNDVSKFIKR